jgi:peptidoglycan hydrolase-like protein with peptidoglycan-binding domain
LKWNPKCLPKYGIDGDFGSETEKAVKAFQAELCLPITGVYDEATRKALTDIAAAVKKQVVVTGNSVNVRTAFVALDSSHGGGMPLIDTVGANGQIKAREPTTSLSMPIWTNTTVAAVCSGTTRLDGSIVDGTNTGYTGWPEILTLETTGNVPISYFGYYGGDNAKTPNAEILGEILLYDTLLDDATRTLIEVYLMNKWTGRLPAGYADFRAATVTGSGSVRVPNVANLPSFENFDGTGVVTQAAFAFTLDPSATPAVPDALTMPCALDLPAACTATVTCATKPRAGTYTLISAASFARPTAWTLNVSGNAGDANYVIRVTETAVLLDVISSGAVIIIR